MRALLLQDFDGPDGVAVADVAPPAADGRRRVLIDVHAAGVSFADLLITRGQYQVRPPLPFVPGLEVAGVVRHAPAETGFAAGDRVAAFMFGGAWLDAGAQQLHLVEGESPPGLGQHFALLVDDLDAAIAELRDGGVEVSDPRPIGRSVQAFLSDPSGNLIELHQAVGG